MADELPPLIATLKGDASDLFSTLSQVESALQAFAGKDYEAQLGLDTTKAFEELAAFITFADAQVITIPVHLDMGGAYAQLAALQAQSALAAGTGSPAGGGGTGGTAGADAATIASLLRSSGGGGGGGAGLAAGAAAGAAGGGGGGGGGLAGLMAALGFGGAGGRFGLGALAGLGTLGSLAGGGAESILTTGLGIAGSAAGAVAGGGALALGTAGVAGVGMATNLAGMGQAAGDARTYTAELDKLNRAIAVYGQNSIQAKAAQYDLNNTMNMLTPAAQQGVIALSQAGQQFHAVFDQMTGAAEATGAAILTQTLGVAQKFLPMIGQFAAQNMKIIQGSLQTLFTWMQGPGMSAFHTLEQTFQNELPTAMVAFDQGVELLIKTLAFLAPYTGKLIDDLAKWLTALNGADFGKFTGDIAKAIGVFRDWEGLIKAVGTAIYELFTHDAGTGTDLIVKLTDMINKFNDWAKTTAGGDSLHALLESHKNELMSIIDVIGHLISAWGQVELVVRPFIMDLVDGLAKVLNFLFEIPGIGPIMGLVFAFEILGSKIGFLGGVLSSFNGMLKNIAIDGLHLLGGALVGLGGPFTALGGWLQGLGVVGPTAAEKAAASMQVAADSMAASAAQISEAMAGVDASADTMAANLTAATAEADAAMEGMAATAETAGATTDAGLAAGGAGALTAGGAAGAGALTGELGGAAVGADALAGGLGTAEVAGTGLLAALGPIGIGIGIAGTAAYILAGSMQSTADGAKAAAQWWSNIQNMKPAATVAQLNQQLSYLTTQHGQDIYSNTAGAPGGPKYTGPNGTAPNTPANIAILNSQGQGQQGSNQNDQTYSTETAKINQVAAALANATINQNALASATGLTTPYVDNLASALGINLGKALSPAQITAFTQYVKDNGGAAGVMGAQWTQASENIQSAMILMAAKAQSAMPGVSAAVRNMITQVQPNLTTLVGNLNKTGDSAGGAFVTAFLAHLSPAQLASKSIHDAINSPLLPLVADLRAVGDTSAANMISAFIGHKSGAQNAAQQTHDAIKNPLYQLQTDLGAVGDTSAANLIADFLKHNPDARTQSGAMHDALKGGLDPLVKDLETIGDDSAAAVVQAFINQQGAAAKAGAAFASSFSSPILAALGAVNAAAGGTANIVTQDLTLMSSLNALAPKHSAGGNPMAAGEMSFVGEHGPELFIAGYSGAIVPINMNMGGGTPITPVSATNAGAASLPQIIELTSNTNVDGRTITTTVTQYQLHGARATGNVLGQFSGGSQSQTATGINTNAVQR